MNGKEKNFFNYHLNKELTEQELSQIIIQDEFEDFYVPPSEHKLNLLEKEEILKKYKKIEDLLNFDDH